VSLDSLFLCTGTFSKWKVFDKHFVIGVVSAFKEGVYIFLCRIRIIKHSFFESFAVSRILEVEHNLCNFSEGVQSSGLGIKGDVVGTRSREVFFRISIDVESSYYHCNHCKKERVRENLGFFLFHLKQEVIKVIK